MGRTHLATVAGIGRARIFAVADPDPVAAEAGRAIARAEAALTDPEAAIADPRVEAVVIVTPTSTHAGLIELAARAGKAVWSEKPIALELDETERVVAAVREAGVPVQLGFMRRYDPGYVAARARIAGGELGRIEAFRALSRDAVPPPVGFLKTSGGIFLDMAVHDLDLARFLVGEVDEVHSWGGVLFDERFTEADDIDTAVTLLRFANGALGTVETARHSEWGYDIRTEVAGALGKVVVEAPRRTDITFSRRSGSEIDHHENFPDRFADAFRLELVAFFDALAEGRVPEPGPEDARETLRLAIACTRSWREGRPIRVSDVTA
jgi:myo-inositol 2-dehydrogenase/D-chiro-inositol 1-dehydrogenase